MTDGAVNEKWCVPDIVDYPVAKHHKLQSHILTSLMIANIGTFWPPRCGRYCTRTSKRFFHADRNTYLKLSEFHSQTGLLHVGDFKCSEQQVTSLISSCWARKWDPMGHGSVWCAAGQIQRCRESAGKEKGQSGAEENAAALHAAFLSFTDCSPAADVLLLSVLFRLLINKKKSSVLYYFGIIIFLMVSNERKNNFVGFPLSSLCSPSLCRDCFLDLGTRLICFWFIFSFGCSYNITFLRLRRFCIFQIKGAFCHSNIKKVRICLRVVKVILIEKLCNKR